VPVRQLVGIGVLTPLEPGLAATDPWDDTTTFVLGATYR
jgi:hypothetical protein